MIIVTAIVFAAGGFFAGDKLAKNDADPTNSDSKPGATFESTKVDSIKSLSVKAIQMPK